MTRKEYIEETGYRKADCLACRYHQLTVREGKSFHDCQKMRNFGVASKERGVKRGYICDEYIREGAVA
jgi:hypothetical protein